MKAAATLFSRIWRPMLVLLPLTFAVNAFLLTGALDIGSEMQTESRLARIGEHWRRQLPDAPLQLDPVTTLYPRYAEMPQAIRSMLDSAQRGIFELDNGEDEYFVLARLQAGAAFYVVEHHSEVKPRDELEWLVFFCYAAGAVPFSLLVLWLYRRTAARIAAPVNAIAQELAGRAEGSVAPVALPADAPRELAILVDQLNQSFTRIADSLERERSFTRFASHELRTPAAVMLAALDRIADTAADSQQAALARARRGLRDMNALVDTFLILSRETAPPAPVPIVIDAAWLQALHTHLNGGRPEQAPRIDGGGTPQVRAPQTVLEVLVGNLLKNAAIHGEAGSCHIVLSGDAIVISNRIAADAANAGFGLGTQIARRICSQFHWRYSLELTADTARAAIQFS